MVLRNRETSFLPVATPLYLAPFPQSYGSGKVARSVSPDMLLVNFVLGALCCPQIHFSR